MTTTIRANVWDRSATAVVFVIKSTRGQTSSPADMTPGEVVGYVRYRDGRYSEGWTETERVGEQPPWTEAVMRLTAGWEKVS
ncbi:MAG TPA: hypothetical protein VEM32_06515 [Geobacteraceae bacterium]|nr:hypothetical protein [Geobacteraceae bacterium]